MMSKQPLRILCIHGYRQNGDSFREKTGSLRKALKRHAELVYLSAPHRVPPLEGSENGGLGWWFSREDDFFKANHQSDFVKGFEDSLKVIEEFVTSHGPFDGLLGFSQGASLLALLCHLQETGALSYSFRFAVFFSGFISQSTPHKALLKSAVSIPSLHVYGVTDQVIGKQMSVDLLKYFEDPVVVEHPGGHFVPASNPQKTAYIQFLEDMEGKR